MSPTLFIRVNVCWRILILRYASKMPTPAKFCWRTPENTYTPHIAQLFVFPNQVYLIISRSIIWIIAVYVPLPPLRRLLRSQLKLPLRHPHRLPQRRTPPRTENVEEYKHTSTVMRHITTNTPLFMHHVKTNTCWVREFS